MVPNHGTWPRAESNCRHLHFGRLILDAASASRFSTTHVALDVAFSWTDPTGADATFWTAGCLEAADRAQVPDGPRRRSRVRANARVGSGDTVPQQLYVGGEPPSHVTRIITHHSYPRAGLPRNFQVASGKARRPRRVSATRRGARPGARLRGGAPTMARGRAPGAMKRAPPYFVKSSQNPLNIWSLRFDSAKSRAAKSAVAACSPRRVKSSWSLASNAAFWSSNP